MKVLDLLASVGPGVREDAIARLLHTQFPSRLGDEFQQVLTLAPLPEMDVVERDDVLTGNDQHVDRSLGVDVAEGDKAAVLEHYIAGNLTARDPTE